MTLKKKLFVAFVFFLQTLFAQYFEFQWSDKIEYSNNKNGFFSGFINTNNQYIYTLNSNYAVSPLNKNNKLKIIAYNKTSMTELASVALKGYPENEASKNDYLTLDYHKTVVLEDRVLVFWTKLINTDSTKTEELYVESFKLDLLPDKKIKKIYSSNQRVDVQQSQFSPSSIVIASNNESDQLIIGSEIHKPGKKVRFNYMVLSSQLNTSQENEISLPSLWDEEQCGLNSSYDYGKDGNIYIRTNVILTREELKKIKQNEAKSYLILSVINPASKDLIRIELKGEDKTITDFSYLVTETKTKIYGFFGDLAKDPTGIDKQGIFYAEIDSDSLTNVQLKYSYFEKTTLNRLFPRSKGGRKKVVSVKSDEETLNTRFDIENIFLLEDGSAVLFFTRKYNYSEITSRSGMDGKNIYKTDYYCEKNNVSAIRITDKGQIIWTSNIDRSITYEGTDISDLKVIYKLNKFYVIYGSESTADTPTKNKKKAPELSDNIDYITFDPVSGKAKKFNLPVNEKEVLKKDKKTINKRSVSVYNGNYYFSQMIVKQKPIWYIANVLFFPSIYYSVLSGNTKYAFGDLAVLILMEGKPNKKKGKK